MTMECKVWDHKITEYSKRKKRYTQNTCYYIVLNLSALKKIKNKRKRVETYRNHHIGEKIVVYTKQPSVALCSWMFRQSGVGVALHIT